MLLPCRPDRAEKPRMRLPLILFVGALVLSACTREEEPVANRFARQQAEIENKARALEMQVENEVSAAEARLDNEASAFLNAARAEANALVADGNEAAVVNAAR